MKNLIKKILRESEWFEDIKEFSILEDFIYSKLLECRILPAENREGWVKYVDKNGKILFADDIDTGVEKPTLWIEYEDIREMWVDSNTKVSDIEEACKKMVWEMFGRRVSKINVRYDLGFYVLGERN